MRPETKTAVRQFIVWAAIRTLILFSMVVLLLRFAYPQEVKVPATCVIKTQTITVLGAHAREAEILGFTVKAPTFILSVKEADFGKAVHRERQLLQRTKAQSEADCQKYLAKREEESRGQGGDRSARGQTPRKKGR